MDRNYSIQVLMDPNDAYLTHKGRLEFVIGGRVKEKELVADKTLVIKDFDITLIGLSEYKVK